MGDSLVGLRQGGQGATRLKRPRIALASPISTSKHPQILERWLEGMGRVVESSGMTPHFLIDGEDERFQAFTNDRGGTSARVSGVFPWAEDNQHHSRRVGWVREQLRQLLLAADWDYALWVDCDTFIPEDAHERLWEVIQEHRTPVASGLVPDRWKDQVVICLNEDYLAMPAGQQREKAPELVQWTGFGCLMVARGVLEKQGWEGYGPIDQHGYPRRGEDTWWCRQVGTGVALGLDVLCQHADNNLSVKWCQWRDGRLVIGTRPPQNGTRTRTVPAVQYIGGSMARHPILGRVELGQVVRLTEAHGEALGHPDLQELQRAVCYYGNPPEDARPNGQWLPVGVEEPEPELDI